MIVERLRTYGICTSGALTRGKNYGIRGHFWQIWWLIWWFRETHFCHEWTRCSCVPAFQSHEILYWSFWTEIRWFSTYLLRHVLRCIANIWQLLPSWRSSESSICGLFTDMFGADRQDVDLWTPYRDPQTSIMSTTQKLQGQEPITHLWSLNTEQNLLF